MLAALLRAEWAGGRATKPAAAGRSSEAPARAAPARAVAQEDHAGGGEHRDQVSAQDARNRRRDARIRPGNRRRGVRRQARPDHTNNHVIDPTRHRDLDRRPHVQGERVGRIRIRSRMIFVDATIFPRPVRQLARARGRRLRAGDRLSRQYRPIVTFAIVSGLHPHQCRRRAARTCPDRRRDLSRQFRRRAGRSCRATSSASTPPSSARPPTNPGIGFAIRRTPPASSPTRSSSSATSAAARSASPPTIPRRCPREAGPSRPAAPSSSRSRRARRRHRG